MIILFPEVVRQQLRLKAAMLNANHYQVQTTDGRTVLVRAKGWCRLKFRTKEECEEKIKELEGVYLDGK